MEDSGCSIRDILEKGKKVFVVFKKTVFFVWFCSFHVVVLFVVSELIVVNLLFFEPAKKQLIYLQT